MGQIRRMVFILIFIAVSYGSLHLVAYALATSADETVVHECKGNTCSILQKTFKQPNDTSTSLIITQSANRAANGPHLSSDTGYMNTTDTFLSAYLAQDKWILFICGLWLFGFLLAFTPCVLPLLVLITTFLGVDNEMSYKRSIFLSLTYVLSLSLTLAIVGIVAAFFGIYLNAYLENRWIIGAFCLLMAALALSLLGFYKLRLPVSMQRYAALHNKIRSNYHFIEVAIMGVLATLITSPCIAPPLVGVLALISRTGNLWLGALSLFAFGLGIGTPLLAATTINKKIIPKSGRWQKILRVFFGLALLAVSIWISSRIVPSSLNMLLWSLLIVFFANYLYSLGSLKHPRNRVALVWKSLAVMVIFYGMAVFFGYMVGSKSPFDPIRLSCLLPNQSSYFYEVSGMTALKNAISNSMILGKPVLVLFTAEWCSECKNFERYVISDPSVITELRNFTLIKVDLSKPASPEQDIARNFHIVGTPAMIFFGATGHLLNTVVTGGDVSTKELTTILSALHNMK